MQDAEIYSEFAYKQQISAIIHSLIESVRRANFIICIEISIIVMCSFFFSLFRGVPCASISLSIAHARALVRPLKGSG